MDKNIFHEYRKEVSQRNQDVNELAHYVQRLNRELKKTYILLSNKQQNILDHSNIEKKTINILKDMQKLSQTLESNKLNNRDVDTHLIYAKYEKRNEDKNDKKKKQEVKNKKRSEAISRHKQARQQQTN